MKRTYIVAIMLVTSAITARAQSSFTTTEYQGKMQPTLVLELPNTTEDAEGTILEKLKETGYNPETKGSLFWKTNKKDGFYVFNKVTLPSVSTQTLDMYFKVVQKNNQEKNNSTVYLLVSSGNNNFVSPESDSVLWKSSQDFLNRFVANTTAYSLEQDIEEQQASLEKSEKKLSALQDDEKQLESKMKENAEGQRLEQMNIDNKRKALEDLKLKRKV